MFSVYKITNLINNKCYIGSSIDVERRWKEHINCSKRKNDLKYNYPLYAAFRKYGINNFNFEVIKDDFESIEEMQEYEKEAILNFNSYLNGYNQTLKTTKSELCLENLKKYLEKISCKCAKIDKNGNILEEYISYHDAARKNNLQGKESHIRKVCKGELSSVKQLIFRDLDEQGNLIEKPFKNYRGKKIIIGFLLENPMKEVFFSSITEAAKKLNSDRASIGKCIKGDKRHSQVKGYVLRELDSDGNIVEVENTIEDIFNEYNRKHPCINGERQNIKEWCKIYGISENTYYNRIKSGMNSIEAIITKKRR